MTSPQAVLAGIGLPTLPQLPALPPLPGLPPLPVLDPAALIKPVTDLFGGFGDGNLNGTGAVSPQAVLQTVVDSVSTATQLLSTGLQLLQSMESAGAKAAAGAATETMATSATISDQAMRVDLTTAAAAGTVATGYAQMAMVATRFAMTSVALGPTLVTPPGQAALLASAIEAGSEAMAITAETKARLVGHTAEMTEAGKPVPVKKPKVPKVANSARAVATTASPTTGTVSRVASTAVPEPLGAQTTSTAGQVDLQQVFSQLQQVVAPLLSLVGQVGTQVLPQTTSGTEKPAATTTPKSDLTTAAAQPLSTATYGAGPVTPAATPLGAWQVDGVLTGPTLGGAGVAPGAAVTVGEVLPPLLPGSGTGGLAGLDRARSGGSHEEFVDARHVDELVGGPPADASTPVIGVTPTGDAAGQTNDDIKFSL